MVTDLNPTSTSQTTKKRTCEIKQSNQSRLHPTTNQNCNYPLTTTATQYRELLFWRWEQKTRNNQPSLLKGNWSCKNQDVKQSDTTTATEARSTATVQKKRQKTEQSTVLCYWGGGGGGGWSVLYSAHIANREAKGNWQHGLLKNTILLLLQKEVKPTISLDGERKRKKQSKQMKQSLLAATLLVSGERERESVQTTVRQKFLLLPGNQRNVLRGIRESSSTLKLIDFLLF